MNLYILEDVLNDYTAGMAVVAASSLERCREVFAAEFAGPYDDDEVVEFDNAIKNHSYKVIESVNHAEGVVSYVYGGG